MGRRFKKGDKKKKTKQYKLTKEDVTFLANHTSFTEEHIEDFYQARKLFKLFIYKKNKSISRFSSICLLPKFGSFCLSLLSDSIPRKWGQAILV